MLRNFSTRPVDDWLLNGTLQYPLLHDLILILPWFFLIQLITIVVCNVSVLWVLFTQPKLRNPFVLYCMSLFFADMGQTLLEMPFTIFGIWSPRWTLGHWACTFRLYGLWVLTAAVRNSHAVISLNRLSSIACPILYKKYHTRKVALYTCIGVWVYAHVMLVPGLMADAIWYREDDGSCMINYPCQRLWILSVEIIVFVLPYFIILLTYPVIRYKVFRREKAARIRLQGSLLAQLGTRTSSRRSVISAEPDTDTWDDHDHSNGSSRMHSANSLDKEDIPAKPKPKPRKISTGFRVLTYLTAGVFLLWTPLITYFIVSIVTDYQSYTVFLITSVFYYCNSILDPVLVVVAIRPLQESVLGVFSKRRK